MFRELCGESALKNACITTTNWKRVTPEEGDKRERELRESPNLFKPLIDAGAELFRWHITEPTSAQLIVDHLIRKDETKLQIQIELDEGKTLEETRAGSVLKEEMIALAEKHKVDMQTLQKEIEEATKTRQAELLAELEEERQMMQEQMLKLQENFNKLERQNTQEQMQRTQDLNELERQNAQEEMQKTQDPNELELQNAQEQMLKIQDLNELERQETQEQMPKIQDDRSRQQMGPDVGLGTGYSRKKNRICYVVHWQKIFQFRNFFWRKVKIFFFKDDRYSSLPSTH